jgi:hypothetical protein
MDDEYLPAISVEYRPSLRSMLLRRLRASERARELALYGGAAISYLAIGVFLTEFVLSWVIAFAWLLLWVWGLPALVRRLRR